MPESGVGSANILLIDDDPSLCNLVRRLLELVGWKVETALTATDGLNALNRSLPDVLLLDVNLPDIDGLRLLRTLKASHRHLPVIMLTADSKVGSVVTAMQKGAWDYLTKPVDRTKLRTTVSNALAHGRMTVRVAQLEKEIADEGYGKILGRSDSMRKLFGNLERIAASDIGSLILGESGTGKELVAQAIHSNSSRADGPFVALNCAAIPESTQESELFGHERGSFTGAERRRDGRFAQADGGTLFLDEVAELDLGLQAKLLRVLQERTFHRLGGNQEVQSDFRLLAATHKDLGEEMKAGRFRQDLFYRIAVFELVVPPLRSRGQDIFLISQRFLENNSTGPVPTLSAEVQQVLSRYSWPGNIRELQNALRHALVVHNGSSIEVSDLPPRLQERARVDSPLQTPEPLSSSSSPNPTNGTPATLTAESTVQPETGQHQTGPSETGPQTEPQTLDQLEEAAIRAAALRHPGNASAAISELGIGRATYYRKLKKYGIQ